LQEEHWLYLYADGRASIYYGYAGLLEKNRSYYRVPAEVADAIKAYALEHGNEDIFDYYRYEKTIYKNPLNWYMVVKENAADYVITEDSVTIRYTNGTGEQIAGSFEKSEVDAGAFAALFRTEVVVPNISGCKQRFFRNYEC